VKALLWSAKYKGMQMTAIANVNNENNKIIPPVNKQEKQCLHAACYFYLLYPVASTFGA
jgi:hypothetical protein